MQIPDSKVKMARSQIVVGSNISAGKEFFLVRSPLKGSCPIILLLNLYIIQLLA